MQVCNKEKKIMNASNEVLQLDESDDDKYDDECDYPFRC